MTQENRRARATGFALLAAALYALSTPCEKRLLAHIGPTLLAALLYLGAGIGMGLIGLVRRGESRGDRLGRRDLPYLAAMLLLDTTAPILLMCGLAQASAANVALLSNFEIAATAVLALALFKEKISGRVWLGIALLTAGSALLSAGSGCLHFSGGSLLVLLACGCWGLENNCTRVLSHADPLRISVIKGFGAGTGALLTALLRAERADGLLPMLAALLLGFAAYGLSIFFYVRAQRDLGAARTSACYAVAPFLGAALSLILFRETPGPLFWAAAALLLGGVLLTSLPPRAARTEEGETGAEQ